MRIDPMPIKVRQLVEGYSDQGEEGIFGYFGQLNIRPSYQREFVYDKKERDLVIDSILNGYPLGVMYWAPSLGNKYEIIDGQQRTISISKFLDDTFSFEGTMFSSMPEDKQRKILNYDLDVRICEGNTSEKLEWFQRINVAGNSLTDQELRNAVNAGPWLADAKKRFSRVNSPGHMRAKKYITKTDPTRQLLLEKVLKWASGHDSVDEYMSRHRHEPNAVALWNYFTSVLDWVESTFTEYRKEILLGRDWGSLYRKYRDEEQDPAWLEDRIKLLLRDDEVTKKTGICEYLLSGDKKHLNLRKFPDWMRTVAYENQEGICAECGKWFEESEMDADHVIPWSRGGKTVQENCQMLCRTCNRRKGAK